MDHHGPGKDTPCLSLIVHHDDAKREYAYDKDTSGGHLEVALEDAGPAGWIVVSMISDPVLICEAPRFSSVGPA